MRFAITALLLTLALTPLSPAAGFAAYSGEEVYAQSCAMCHALGTGGAPRPGVAEEWRGRLGPGRADLLRSVLRGKGGMPPKGGNASLTVGEAYAALDFMLSGGNKR